MSFRHLWTELENLTIDNFKKYSLLRRTSCQRFRQSKYFCLIFRPPFILEYWSYFENKHHYWIFPVSPFSIEPNFWRCRNATNVEMKWNECKSDNNRRAHNANLTWQLHKELLLNCLRKRNSRNKIFKRWRFRLFPNDWSKTASWI